MLIARIYDTAGDKLVCYSDIYSCLVFDARFHSNLGDNHCHTVTISRPVTVDDIIASKKLRIF